MAVAAATAAFLPRKPSRQMRAAVSTSNSDGSLFFLRSSPGGPAALVTTFRPCLLSAESKRDIMELKAEWRGDIQELKEDSKRDIKELKEDSKRDVKELKEDSKRDIEELKEDMKELRAELKGDTKELKAELREDMTRNAIVIVLFVVLLLAKK